MKTTKLYLYFLLSIFCFSITIPAQSSQVEELGAVLTAHIEWNNAKANVLQIKIDKGLAELDIKLKTYAVGANEEQYAENIAGIISGIGVDPLDIASSAVVELAGLINNIVQASSLNDALTKAEDALSKVEEIIGQYTNEASNRKTRYEDLRKAYEDKYGSIDPNAPPTLSPPNFCIRGDACTMKELSNPADPEGTSNPLPPKDRWVAFWSWRTRLHGAYL